MRAAQVDSARADKQQAIQRRAAARHQFEAESKLRTRQQQLLRDIAGMLQRHGRNACQKIVTDGAKKNPTSAPPNGRRTCAIHPPSHPSHTFQTQRGSDDVCWFLM